MKNAEDIFLFFEDLDSFAAFLIVLGHKPVPLCSKDVLGAVPWHGSRVG